MQLEEAKKLILEAIEDGGWVERSVKNDFVRLKDQDNSDPVLLQALEELLKSGELDQVPTAGQSRTTVAYHKSTAPVSK